MDPANMMKAMQMGASAQAKVADLVTDATDAPQEATN